MNPMTRLVIGCFVIFSPAQLAIAADATLPSAPADVGFHLGITCAPGFVLTADSAGSFTCTDQINKATNAVNADKLLQAGAYQDAADLSVAHSTNSDRLYQGGAYQDAGSLNVNSATHSTYAANANKLLQGGVYQDAGSLSVSKATNADKLYQGDGYKDAGALSVDRSNSASFADWSDLASRATSANYSRFSYEVLENTPLKSRPGVKTSSWSGGIGLNPGSSTHVDIGLANYPADGVIHCLPSQADSAFSPMLCGVQEFYHNGSQWVARVWVQSRNSFNGGVTLQVFYQ